MALLEDEVTQGLLFTYFIPGQMLRTYLLLAYLLNYSDTYITHCKCTPHTVHYESLAFT